MPQYFARVCFQKQEHQNSSINSGLNAIHSFILHKSFFLFEQFLSMKLVLKLKETVKLADSTLNYEELLAFIEKEHHLKKESISLSFIDDEGDNITVMSDEDLEVMIAVHDGKQYVRINVEGQVEEQKEEEKANDSLLSDEPVEEVKQEAEKSEKVEEKAHPEPQVEIVEVKPEPQIEEPAKVQEIVVEKVEQPVEEEAAKIDEAVKFEEPVASEAIPEVAEKPAEEAQEEKKESKEEAGEPDHMSEHCRRRKWQKMQNYLNQTVARLVDQRIKALIPCIREQLAQQPEKPKQPEAIVHQGYECKACQVSPITGIRYECPTCPLFSLCAECETKIDHEHNLLKIKKIVEKKPEKESFFRGFFHGRGHHGRGSSGSRDKCDRRRNHWFDRKCWGLSNMFGGQPEDYAKFVNENSELRPRQTYKKYADLQNITPEEFTRKLLNLRCDQLSACFNKPADSYRKFVEDNSDLGYRQLVNVLISTGVENKDNKKCWWGAKRYNFNDASCEERKPSCKKEKRCSKERECKKEKKCSQERECKKEKRCSKEKECKRERRCPFAAEPKVEEKSEKVEEKVEVKAEEPKVEVSAVEISPSVLKEEFIKEPTEITRQKGEIMMTLKDLFGDSPDKNKEYFKFIEKNFSKGADRIVELWLDSLRGSF